MSPESRSSDEIKHQAEIAYDDLGALNEILDATLAKTVQEGEQTRKYVGTHLKSLGIFPQQTAITVGGERVNLELMEIDRRKPTPSNIWTSYLMNPTGELFYANSSELDGPINYDSVKAMDTHYKGRLNEMIERIGLSTMATSQARALIVESYDVK